MEYQVLIVEDDGKIYKMLQEELESDYKLIRVRAVDEAIGAYRFMKKKGLSFDCFIIDLALIASGLTDQEMDDYENKEGFAFLKKIWKEHPEDEEYVRARTIICSRYISKLQTEHLEDELKYLSLISKEDKEFERKVTEAVNKIVKGL